MDRAANEYVSKGDKAYVFEKIEQQIGFDQPPISGATVQVQQERRHHRRLPLSTLALRRAILVTIW